MTRIAILDYGMGNLRSVEKAFEHVGASAVVTHDHEAIRGAAGIVLPGVGAFPKAMQSIRGLGLDEVIAERLAAGVPMLGICLGMQLLFDRSEEREPTDGIGLIAGEVTRLNAEGQRIPHIGWNEVRFQRASPLTSELPEAGAPFYHVHSFAVRPREPAAVIGTSEYGERFATIVARQSVFGVQFHPEKSSKHGLRLLANFVALTRTRTAARSATARA